MTNNSQERYPAEFAEALAYNLALSEIEKAEIVQSLRLSQQQDRALIKELAEAQIYEIKGITLGDNYIGKITEAEAIALINAVINGQNQITKAVYKKANQRLKESK